MDPYSEGFSARLRGAEIEDNPHERPTLAWSRWAEGWLAQDRHLTERDEVLESIGWFGAR